MELDSTILITGASGVLGSAIVNNLQQKGYQRILKPRHTELNLLDQMETKRWLQENHPDYVFHLASVVYGLKGNDINQWKALTENTVINHNLFSGLSQIKPKKIFFAGTVAGYPDRSPMPQKEENFFNGLPHAGEFGYAMSKRHAYGYLKLLNDKFDIPFCYGIFTNIFGKHDRFNLETGHVIPSLLLKAYLASKYEKSLRVWGSPETTRDFIYSEDAAEAAVIGIEKAEGLLNIATNKEVSMGRVAEAIVNSFGGLRVIWENNQLIGISRRRVDNSRLKALGWIPRWSFENAIKSTATWVVNNFEYLRK